MTTSKKSVIITEALHHRLSRLKKGKSFNDYLEEVATFLEHTDPSIAQGKITLGDIVKRQATRVIEVARGIEKRETEMLEAILQRLDNWQALPQPTPAVGAGLTAEEQAHIEELIALNKEQAETIRKLQSENTQLKTQAEVRVPQAAGGILPDEVIEEASQQLQNIATSHTPDMVNKSKLYINKVDLRMMLEKLDDLIRSYGSDSTPPRQWRYL